MKIPKEVEKIAANLQKQGFSAYIVGGCVRDLLLKKMPIDWDVATDAEPKEIQKVFDDTVYENEFGTVGIKTESKDVALKVVEVTTFRKEGGYSDKRHPDDVTFAKTIEEDLARRDFTMNALAYEITQKSPKLIDPFEGEKDLEKKLIRAVGKAEDRFDEDALRILRAVRLSAQLGFSIEKQTQAAIVKKVTGLKSISQERIRDEFEKLVMSDGATDAVLTMQETGILKYVLPELEEGVGVGQNKHHIYTVFEHNLKSFGYSVEKKHELHVRVASLLHDVGKPQTKRGEGINSTFYGHQVIGERIARKALDRLRFSKQFVENVALLVREHMFVYDPDVVTEAGVRRLIRRVGPENVDDLIRLREADRIGSGVPKAQPYRLRYLRAMIEKVQEDPIHPKMLKIKGDAVIEILQIEPGPRVGKILAVLLEEVLEDPSLNRGDGLKKRVKELGALPEKKLSDLAKKAKASAEAAQKRIDDDIKKKYFVK